MAAPLSISMRRAFSHFASVCIAASVAAILFIAIISIPALPLIGQLLRGGVITALPYLPGIFLGTVTDVAPAALLFAATTSTLAGINAALAIFYVRMSRKSTGSVALGGTGGILALFGAGCAACGSVMLTALSATFGADVLALLPFGGAEIGTLSIALFLASILWLSRSINKPLVCPL